MERFSLLDSISTTEDSITKSALPGIGEVLLGKLDAIDENGNAVISLLHTPLFQQSVALTTIPVSVQHIGRQIAVMFTQGTEQKPIIIGFIYSPLQQVLEDVLNNTNNSVGNNADELVFTEPSLFTTSSTEENSKKNALQIDGKQLILEGHEEIVLRCGEASITLNRSGKISIRGKYLLSRATGVNRILGGSVQVN